MKGSRGKPVVKEGGERLLSLLLILLSLLGVLISGYLLREHIVPHGSSFCDFNEKISCDVVNKSPYASLLGVPVSLLGLLYYAFLFLLLLFWRQVALFLGSEYSAKLLVAYTVLGLLFSIYFTLIEAFVLKVWCPFCILSALNVLCLVVLSFLRAR